MYFVVCTWYRCYQQACKIGIWEYRDDDGTVKVFLAKLRRDHNRGLGATLVEDELHTFQILSGTGTDSKRDDTFSPAAK